MGALATRLLPLRWVPREAPALNPPSRLGLAALEVARHEIGRGETGANNRGPDVARYRRGVDDGQPWCAAFVSYCLEEAALHLGLATCPVARSHAAKRLWRHCAAAGLAVEHPREGDLALWHRGIAGARTGHIGLVSRADRLSSLFWAIEGNKGAPPASVREFDHALGEGGLLGFARPPLFRLEVAR